MFCVVFGLVLFVICVLLVVFLFGDVVLCVGWEQMLLFVLWVLFGLWVVYEIVFVLVVCIDDGGVVVQNMFCCMFFGWRWVWDIDLCWQLVFFFDDGIDVICYGGLVCVCFWRMGGEVEESKVLIFFCDFIDICDRWEVVLVNVDVFICWSWDVLVFVVFVLIVVWVVFFVFIVNVG